jgi:gas vesicle protein
VKTQKLLKVVEDGTHTAVAYVTPYVAQVLREGGEFAGQTYVRIQPVIKDVKTRGARLAADTFDRVHPVIDDALDKVSPAVNATVKVVKPAVDDVLQRIPPTVDQARERVQADYLPRLAAALRDLAREPLGKELKVAAASAALAKELEKASKPKRSGWKTFGLVLLAGAVLGGAVTALRKLLSDPSTGWETHTPKSAYVADPVADVADDVREQAAAETGHAGEPVGGIKDTAAGAAAGAGVIVEDVTDADTDLLDDIGGEPVDLGQDLSDQAVGVPGDLTDTTDTDGGANEDIEDRLDRLADEAEGGDASPLAGSPYGTGSYVGSEPPQGYTIKGNDRSMKYHLPGTAAYDRTVAEVWFQTEEAAREAGFVRAGR